MSRVFHSIEEIRPGAERRAVALGTFDGVHLGHQAVLAAAAEQAARRGERLAAFTFAGNPSGAPAVCTPADKLVLLAGYGAEALFAVPFAQVRDMAPEAFFSQVLVERCGAGSLCCGEDFRFGKNARGDVALLARLCRENGMALRVVPPVRQGGEKVSSTRIRAAVEAGDIPLAVSLLGHGFGYALEVIHGRHLGTGLGTPTINQAMPEDLVLPPFGVYASLARLDGRETYGVTNIGVKPTVGSDRVLSETWFPEYAGDLYGKAVRLSLLAFLRPERKFPDLNALKAQILRDAAQAGEIAKNPGKTALQNGWTVLE